MDDKTKTEKMLSRKDGRVGYVIFNNPERRNAVSLDMWARTTEILTDFARDDEVRVVVLTGAGGKAFVSGADVSRFESERSSLDATRVYNQTVEKANASIYEFPKPTIAMIRGYCIGGGLGLAVCCDLRICSDNSKFAIPAAKLGLGYGYAGVKRLTDVVGPAFAKEIFYTARQFDAEEARVMGIVNRVVPAAELEAQTMALAEQLANAAPLALRGILDCINVGGECGIEEGLEYESVQFGLMFSTQDMREGTSAFLERRKPEFKGE